ncbi:MULTISPECIES: GNAT family N-acetyltransferase [unclassified Streptomyces]|uniref:GNAT family N-acetyltransferase n=1 Tax=unclassified Streptomyces TaxID=2593676 RepID=UPI0022B64378|nr:MULTISPECIES: GNAT family protein [unclassified Streptomyces]MCZ7416938.1 GNAT family protein [Streptomyces sp. WMMC897]MCZ7433232.1 GNAT family protein [Streptomyces sp. WMMC1477]
MYATSLGDDGAELRPIEPWQAEEFFAHIERGREFIGQYVGMADVVSDLEKTRAFLQRYADRVAADTARICGIHVDGQLVGGVMFLSMDHKRGVAEAGCWLEPSAAGRGLVTRACRVLFDWGFERRGLHRVEWQASTANAPSIAVARRLGMTRDGVLRESYLYRGKRHDMEVWSVLADEWRTARERR